MSNNNVGGVASNDPLKVALIEPVGGHGGMLPYDLGLINGLKSAGVDTAWFSSDESTNISGVDLRKIYHGVFGGGPSWIRGLRFIKGSFTAIFIATRENRHICHFHFFNTGVLELIGVLVARIFFRSVVLTVHDVEPFVEGKTSRILMRIIYLLSKKIIVHNIVSQQELMALGNVPFEKISVIPHGNYLDTISDIPQKDKARNKLRLPDDAKIILFFGQIKQVKGLDILLRAMKNVSLVYPDVLCVIAGRPWKLEFCEYELLIQSLKLEKNIVTDIRYIPDDDIRFYYSACDLVVLPYRRIYQSGVLLQAMSYQRPVLVSDLPGMTEIVSDGVNGYVFESGSHEALAEKIISFFNNRDASNKVGVRGMQYVKASHDWVSIGARTRDLYLECLSK